MIKHFDSTNHKQVNRNRLYGFLILAAVAFGFAAGLFWRGQEVANCETLIKAKDGQMDAYQKSINDRLENVEKKLSAQ